jgi:UDP-glucose 4-epimerase
MKIFITGVESFVGHYLRNILKKKNKHQITGIDKNKNLPSTKKFDINDKDLFKVIPNNCDCLIHLAAVSTTDSFKKDPSKSFDVNVNGTFNVMQAAIKKNVKQIIFASSEWVYGEEKSSKVKNEKNPLSLQAISSDYTLSKILGEQIVEYYSAKNKISCTILRFGIIYGPRIKDKNISAVESIIKTLITKNELTVGSKKTARKFIYITDLCEAINKAIGIKNINKFNITGNQLINLDMIYKEVKKNLKKDVKIFETNKKSYNIRNIDNKSFKKISNWKPKIDIREGVKNIIDILKKN